MLIRNLREIADLVNTAAKKLFRKHHRSITNHVFGSIEDAEQVGWVRMVESKKIKEILENDAVKDNEGLIVTIAYRGMIDYIRSVAGREGKTGKASGKAQQIFMTSYYMDYYSNEDGDLMDIPFSCKKNDGAKIYEHVLANEIEEFMKKKLSKREKMIMDYIYKGGLKQREVSKLFSVTESRITQMKDKAIKTVIKAMGE